MQRSSLETLDSSLSRFQEYNALPNDILHSFSAKGDSSSNILKDLIETTSNLSQSLAAYSSTEWTSDKLVSLLRQSSAISQTLYTSEHQSRHIISALRERAGVSYGESVPLNPAQTPDWCVSRIEEWCKLAGLETFKDDSKAGDSTTITCGGKVLVVDGGLQIQPHQCCTACDHSQQGENELCLTQQQQQLQHMSGTKANAMGSLTLDDFLLRTIQAFLTEAQRENNVRDPRKASRLGKDILVQLQYLVMVDRLAERPGADGGLKWFIGLDEVYPPLEEFGKKEAMVIASTSNQTQVPLDIFLHRSHALPLPYLLTPSQSFLVYMSPLSYLTTLQSKPPSKESSDPFPFDIPLSHIRKTLSDKTDGATIATLLLVPSQGSRHTFIASHRPMFPLAQPGDEVNYTFPQLDHNSMAMSLDIPGLADTGTDPHQYEWVLDFTNNGKTKGVVMSQSRMREVELVINPLSGVENSASGLEGMRVLQGENWVDLLLNKGQMSEFYTAIYTSPSLGHPPLKLRLTTPREPGFIFERVPVHNIREVWGILEIVREQCWLNETLLGCDWKPEDSRVLEEPLTDSGSNFEQELQAILSGTYMPQMLPVNVFIPTDAPSFDPLSIVAPTQPHRPKILMASPERAPFTGLVEISVSFDELKERGVDVDVRGAVGADIKKEVLEEVARRGGLFGIPGRVWLRSHGVVH